MNQHLESILSLTIRDLKRLGREIENYKDEENLWVVANEINNSGGNLCMHICGNLQHFVGEIIGKSGYVRKREAEFESKNIPKSSLLAEIDKTKEAVTQALEKFEEVLQYKTYPIEVLGKPMTYDYFLVHLYGHLNYHLGQINYHRRILEE